jgi:hypothetical protein
MDRQIIVFAGLSIWSVFLPFTLRMPGVGLRQPIVIRLIIWSFTSVWEKFILGTMVYVIHIHFCGLSFFTML